MYGVCTAIRVAKVAVKKFFTFSLLYQASHILNSTSAADMALSVRLARGSVWRRELAAPALDIPTFLCPALLNYNPRDYPRLPHFPQQRSSLFKAQRRCLHLAQSKPSSLESPSQRALPIQCTGCGAYAQTNNEEEPGFYSLNRNAVKAFLQGEGIAEDIQLRRQQEEDILLQALQNADRELAASLNLDVSPTTTPTSKNPSLDRTTAAN